MTSQPEELPEDEATEAPEEETVHLTVKSDTTRHSRSIRFDGAPSEPCYGKHAGKRYQPHGMSLAWIEDEGGARVIDVALTGPRQLKEGGLGVTTHHQSYAIEHDGEYDRRPILPGWAMELLGNWADDILKAGS